MYLAVDGSLNREVALKLLKPALVTDTAAFDRFQKEARAAAVLFHYNIATVFEIGEIEGRYFISMRYIKGKSLDQVLKEEGPQDWEEVLRMTGQLSEALDFAHQRGFSHRDIKPSNIIRGEDGQYVLTDFGLVRAMMDTGLSSHTGAMIGTPAYMAPEVWEGRESTPAADQYALACVIYEMLTGEVLFAGDTPPAVMMAHFKPVEFSIALLKHFPEQVPNTIMTALARNPGDRFERLSLFYEALALPKDEDSTEAPATSANEHGEKDTDVAEEGQKPPTEAEISEKLVETGEELNLGKKIDDQSSLGIEKEAQPAERLPLAKKTWFWIGGITLGVALILLFVLYIIPQGQRIKEVKKNRLESTQEMQPSIAESQEMGIEIRLIDGMEMVYVPAGEFLMGSDSGDDDEGPVHIVYLDAYWIDRTEVTNAQFAKFLNEKGNQEEGGATWLDAGDEYARIHLSDGEWVPDSGYADHPVVKVSWYGAQAFCEWVGGRLPMEAEWEKAARSVDGREYPWGNEDPTCDLAQFDDFPGKIVPVGSFPDGASPYGALDMAGNVWEWVGDWYDEDYYDQSSAENPKGPDSGDKRVIRGGSWYFSEGLLRVSYRSWYNPGSWGSYGGFRCFRSP